MNLKRAFKYRIYPTKKQKILIEKHFGCTRFLFNYFLDKEKSHYLNNKESIEAKRLRGYFGYYNNAKRLTELKHLKKFEWLNEVSAQSLQYSLKHLDQAYKNFFKKQSNFPKFKKKRIAQSFSIGQMSNVIKITNGKIQIIKFKEGIKAKIDRPIQGRIMSATLSRNSAGQYFISLLCESSIPNEFPKTKSSVGIDVGIKTLATCSNGTKYENPKILNRYQKKLKYQHRQLSKKKKGHNQRKRTRYRLAKTYNKITNIRKDNLHKITTELVKNHDNIFIEDLKINNILQEQKAINRSIYDVAIFQFFQYLEYKANWYGKTVIKIDRYFPSSKTCSVCEYINEKLKITDRTFNCPNCDIQIDRDLNASKNILKQGLSLYPGRIRT